MAKITPSSLITAIQGKINNTTFQLWKGAICLRRVPKLHMGNVQGKSMFKGIASVIAGRWYGLSSNDKTSWDTYAGYLPTEMSGFNAFLARNVALLYADNPTLCYYTTAPNCYYAPATPAPFCVSWISGSQNFCVQWTTPSLISHFVQAFLAPQIGYLTKKFPSVKLAKTTVSTAGEMTVSGSSYPSGTVMYFKIRTIDVYGQISSYSDVKTATII
ncbi:MAG: hypothetical protein P8078_00175 [bacterium]